jgi:hypothetical protein
MGTWMGTDGSRIVRKAQSTIYGLAALIVVSCGGADETSGSYPYSPAFVDARQQLQVFPFEGSAYAVPLPFALSYVSYPADARSLYGVGGPVNKQLHGLFQIEFNPVRVSVVRGTAELGMFSVAIPLLPGPIVVSGKYQGACGIFAVDRRSGQIRLAAQNSTCEYAGSWVWISLSPDGKRAVG